VIGLDTNVLVRYLTQDDPAQSRKAAQVIESTAAVNGGLFLSNVVLCEAVWVLEDVYGHTPTDVAEILERILRTGQFAFEERAVLWQALDDYQQGKGDFSDYLLGRVAQRAGCSHTLTFDRALKSHRLFKVL
jgi:predicted nucleic-acid-binding protein